MRRMPATTVLLALCIPVALRAQHASLVEAKRGEEPVLNSRVVKDVGDVIYAKFDYAETQGIRLDEQFAAKHLARKLAIPPGTFLWTYLDKRNITSYCADPALVAGLWKQDTALCFRDTNEDGRLDSLHIPGTAFGGWSPLKAPARYREDSRVTGGVGYRYELLYQGVAADVLRLAYREFVNDFARPSFTQDLTYTLDTSGEGEVVFRGARLRVHQASNESITYEVLSGIREK